MDDEKFEISIPADNDGYILHQCEHCGEYFKLKAEDCNDDGILRIVCPACGLESKNYLTDDVIELALSIAKNYANEIIHDAYKTMERKMKRIKNLNIKLTKKAKREPENPLHSGIQALEIVCFPCCHHSAKVKPLLKMTGCYCPCCGVKNYEFE